METGELKVRLIVNYLAWLKKKKAALTYLGLDITNSLKYHPHIMINSNWKFSPSSLSGIWFEVTSSVILDKTPWQLCRPKKKVKPWIEMEPKKKTQTKTHRMVDVGLVCEVKSGLVFGLMPINMLVWISSSVNIFQSGRTRIYYRVLVDILESVVLQSCLIETDYIPVPKTETCMEFCGIHLYPLIQWAFGLTLEHPLPDWYPPLHDNISKSNTVSN